MEALINSITLDFWLLIIGTIIVVCLLNIIVLLPNQKKLLQAQKEFEQRLFQNLVLQRDNLTASMTSLQVDLEKRFGESNLAFVQNIDAFKYEISKKFAGLQSANSQVISDGQLKVSSSVHEFTQKISVSMEKNLAETRGLIEDNIKKGIMELRGDLDRSLHQQNELLNRNIGDLTEQTQKSLKSISVQVEEKLTQGFDKTNQTFSDILKRLALIDDAQKKITELSSNVVSLQEVLNDKRSRGAFGEVQLKALVDNAMPTSHYQLQKKLSNDKVVDCLLMLPEPTGNIAIDSKFPLENYKLMTDVALSEIERKAASKQFERDIKKHIDDIASKYIIPPETSDGAVMFIPAESVFAEIHGHYPKLVEYAYQNKVWLVSPTTLMAILTTASAVIKDEQTRQQIHIIKEHLSSLGKDFVRFQDRMNSLSKHIDMVSKDVQQVHVSAKKITSRFDKIERVELIETDSEANTLNY